MSMATHSNIPTAVEHAVPIPSERLVRPFARFASMSSAGGIVLLICTVIAMVWANSGAADSYQAFINAPMNIGVGSWLLEHGHMTVGIFINDALMAVFFLLVGLEIKREVLVGELSDIKKATLPIAGAVGGMVAPALVYVMFNLGGKGIHGWGVPMATDIAFALGILALLGRRVPNSLRIFLTSLAIADDLGALLVIALFYTQTVKIEYLAVGAGIVAILIGLNKLGFKQAIWFIVPGIFLWYCFLESGVHATIAGVVLAATIPVNPRVHVSKYSNYTRAALDCFDEADDPTQDIRTNSTQRAAVLAIEKNNHTVLPLLHRMEHGLHGWVAFLIIPIFALANAGLHLSGNFGDELTSKVSLGVIFGLVLGKPIGIILACVLTVKLGLGTLSKGVTWRHMIGASCLAGVGFTMALFIANLGFEPGSEMHSEAKLGILVGSMIAAFLGLAALLSCPSRPEPEPEEAGPVMDTSKY